MKPGWGTQAVAAAVVLSAALFVYAFETRSRAYHEVTVVGSGTRDFDSDLLVWSGSFTRKDPDLKAAYAALNQDREKVKQFLIAKGAPERDDLFSSISIEKEYEDVVRKDETRARQFTGYRLTQRVQVESKEVEKFEKISREITDLINNGVELTSGSPEYFYTKLPELKIAMVAEATRDARQRAEKIAENAGGTLGKLRSATLGVFQITAQNSSEEYSWRGNFNTGSRRKTAAVTMRLQYQVQ